ncbi:MAG TPA: hypothetical protein VLA09_09495 [Longimicrobiales bacterium]|nr:hypothetical protein [Longimicrobiales bacterium]
MPNRWLGQSTTAPLLLPLAIFALPSQSVAQEPAVTFTADVAPILQESCVTCHRENSIAPMSLRTYREVRPWARAIKNAVQNRVMPPFHYDSDVGSIQNLKDDWRLSEEDIETISAWADAGAPQGDPAAMPAQREFPPYDGWALAAELGREPDLVMESAPYDVPIEGGDIWWRPVMPIPIDRDRKVLAMETRPTYPEGVQVVHHANPYLLLQNEETGEWEQQGEYTEYAMGKVGEMIPEDAYRILPKDGMIQWDIHYYPGGSAADKVAADDNVVKLAFWFYEDDEAPELEQVLTAFSLEGDIALPPGGTAMTQGFYRWDHPVRIDSFQPHGHVHLHAMSLQAIYPPEEGDVLGSYQSTGTDLISMVTNFSALWHHSYIYPDDEAPIFPTGTVMVLTGWYDNTADNPLATDPNVWVTRGSRTHDEMSHAWIAVTHLTEEEYEKIREEREAATRPLLDDAP